MEKYFNVLRACPLFYHIEDDNLMAMLRCLKASVKTFRKKSQILSEGDTAKYIGIVLAGTAQIEQTDYFGNRSIVASLEPSDIFGESFACAGVEKIPVDITAVEDTEVLFVDCLRITQSCSNACIFHRQVIYNLLKIVATKNLLFHQRIRITSQRTTREKLMAYLMIQAKKAGSNCFEISYDRQELADYLEVDRSGLSAEISKLRKEGILKSEKNKFVLLKPQ
ncbi:MAG: Crp/Fnr family transcriptional regulator [Lachnospiraceae bacterium]|nr:Crp/Fnr family transcriptional regulator [Robinsoniella sp.]MDY3767357.1 Crp/Fnr family transcriptional regulator [Lachnospiraceae bacterium]